MEAVIRPLLYPVLWLGAAGFAACLFTDVLDLTGQPNPMAPLLWPLAVGMFVVWLPTVLVANVLARGAKQAELWKAVLRGCPTWMSRGVYVVFAYALITMLFSKRNDAGFSAILMSFYYIATAVMYSATRLENMGARRCPHGHEVSTFANYCDVCGWKVPPAPLG
jgi:hypothetical protein